MIQVARKNRLLMYNDCMKKMFRFLLTSFICILFIGYFQINTMGLEPVVELDTTAPIITIEPYLTNYTDQSITVNASTNEGTLNATSYTFTENGSFEFIATDLAGNVTKEVVTISNIIKKLNVPLNFRILSINYNQIELEWESVLGADTYDVYQGTSSTTLNKVANVSTTQYKTGSLNFNQVFYFRVVPISNNIKATTSSPIISARTTLRIPSELNTSLTSSSSSTLSWLAVDGAQGYELSYSKGTSTSFSILKTITTTNTTHTGLSLNTKYNYRVRAYRLIGTTRIYSNYSTVQSVMTPPVAPSIKVISKDANTLVLSWNSVLNATGYEVYVDNILINSVDSSVLSQDISDLNIGQTYSLKIITLNGELRSNPSIAVTGVPVPSAPTDFKIVSKNYNGFNLSWNSVENNTLYEVWRSTSSTGTYSLVGTTQETQFIDTKASFNVTYYYKVRSTIDLIKGSFSNVISGKTTLITPSGINVTLGTSSTSNLSWLAVDGAQGYEISYSKGTSTTYTVLRSVTSLLTSHTGLTLNTKYNYRVRAYRLVGTTRIYSAYSELRSIITPPVAPSIKVISKDSNTLILSWNSVLNATAYEIYQDNMLIDTVGNNTLTKDVTNLQLGIPYQYKVVAVNGELRSNPSVVVSGTPIPAAPINLSITNPNYNGFIIQWDSVIESTSYEVWRSTSLTGTYTLLSTINQTEYLDNKANFNTTYFYKVRAIVNSIKGTFTNTISGKTTLLIPQDLQVNLLTPSSANIVWDAVDGAQGYEISYVKGTSTTYTVLRTVTSLSTSHTGLSLNSTYTYRVRAYRLVGTTRIYSAFSALQRITTPPVAPTIKVVSKDANTLVLSWNSVLNATAYEIYQDNVLIDTVDKNTLTKEVSNLQLGTTYQYKLIALNGELRSSFSTSVTSIPIPAAPTNLSISNPNYNGFTIKWDSVIDSTNYEVWRSTSLTGTYTLLSTINQTEYLDNKANFNTTYYYRVRAIVNNIKGSYSNIINHKTSLQSPKTIDLVATNASSSRITWTAVDGAQGYEVFYAKGTSTSFTLLRSVTSLTTNHTGLTLNSKYTYRVRAYRLVGTTRIYSAYSENFVIDYNSTFVLPHLAGILGTSTGVEDSKLKITNYLNARKVGNIKFVIGDYNVGIGQVFNQTPDAMTTPHIYDLITVYISNS